VDCLKPNPDIPSDRESLQRRRAEKSWMFRDSERSWQQFIYTICITAQSVFLAVFSLIASGEKSDIAMCYLGSMFWITAIEFAVISVVGFFETSIKSAEEKVRYDNRKADKKYNKHNKVWRVFDFFARVYRAGVFLYTSYALSDIVHGMSYAN
jgi:hypothetical protein